MIKTFGATLVSDGKDDVCKDHLINYVTVTPESFKWSGSQDVSGIVRKADWVCADLMAKLKECQEELVDEVPTSIK